jgi:hypothetical protein
MTSLPETFQKRKRPAVDNLQVSSEHQNNPNPTECHIQKKKKEKRLHRNKYRIEG